jgi:two-component system KDP operon response regulator KdpE
VVRPITILVVDDEPRIRRFVRAELEEEGYRVLGTETGEDALGIVERNDADLVVLDLVLPGLSGFETLQRIRQASSIPVILLTARGGDRDKIQGLNLGADDYLTKPFNPEELTARIRAVLRRTRPPLPGHLDHPLVVGDLRVDSNQRRVLLGEQEISLSPTEWQLLYHLVNNAGRVILHEDLLAMAWGPAYRNDLQYLRVWISRLRRKLRDDPASPRLIRTVPGVGYMLKAG